MHVHIYIYIYTYIIIGKGQMRSALMGSLHVLCFLTEGLDFGSGPISDDPICPQPRHVYATRSRGTQREPRV